MAIGGLSPRPALSYRINVAVDWFIGLLVRAICASLIIEPWSFLHCISQDGPFGNTERTWHGSVEEHSLVRLRGFAAVDAFPNIARATTHDGFERSATFEHVLDLHASPYRALKFAQEFAMALRPADFAGLIPLINAFRVTIEYKKPVYWRGDPGYTYPLTTAGVLWREQARRKSRGWNNCGVFGPDGPDY